MHYLNEKCQVYTGGVAAAIPYSSKFSRDKTFVIFVITSTSRKYYSRNNGWSPKWCAHAHSYSITAYGSWLFVVSRAQVRTSPITGVHTAS